MNLATEMGRLSGRAMPSLQDDPFRQNNETGRHSTYLLPIAVQTNRATSQPIDRPAPAARDPEHEITLIRPLVALQVRQNAPARTNPKPIYPFTSAWGPRVPALEGFVRKRPKPFTDSVIPSPHPKCLVLT